MKMLFYIIFLIFLSYCKEKIDISKPKPELEIQRYTDPFAKKTKGQLYLINLTDYRIEKKNIILTIKVHNNSDSVINFKSSSLISASLENKAKGNIVSKDFESDSNDSEDYNQVAANTTLEYNYNAINLIESLTNSSLDRIKGQSFKLTLFFNINETIVNSNSLELMF